MYGVQTSRVLNIRFITLRLTAIYSPQASGSNE